MKLLVTINSGSLAGQTYELKTGFLTIGRDQSCSIRLDPMNERIASKQHAFIEAAYDGYYLTDNQSMNGTFVNGEAVQRLKLSEGDSIQFGKNGVVAKVRIDHGSAASSSASREEFRRQQVKQFNSLANQQPQSVQDSLSGIGLGRIEPRPQSPNTSLFVGLGVLVLTVPILVTIVVLILFQNVGPEPAVIAAVIAFTPAMLYILPMMWLDRYDPEPLWLLALAFTWGALVAVVVSYYVNTSFGQAIYSQTGNAEFAELASTILSAPVIEEGSKGAGLLVLLALFRKYFDDILDGIVFGSIIALGFATVENVLYYCNGINEAYEEFGWTSSALWSFLILFAIRGMFSPFAHATFTSMTGIGCGIARESHKGFVKFVAPVIGYTIAVVLHMIWNGMTYVAYRLLYEYNLLGVCETIGLAGRDTGACAFLAAYVVLQVPFFIFLTVFIAYIVRRQRRILNEMLAIDIARGLIPEEHAKIATSVFRGQRWRFAGLANGKYLARSRYMRSIGKLGLSYWHIQRATIAKGETASYQQNPILRDEVLKWRDQV
jgi:RsiW-degrading membrane proteinase PrsW (M82 family)